MIWATVSSQSCFADCIEEHVLDRKITKGGNLQAGCLQRSLLAPTCHLWHHHQYHLLPCLNIPSGLRPLGPSRLITSPSFCSTCPVEEGCYWAGEALIGSGHILGHLLLQSCPHQRSELLLIRCLCKCPSWAWPRLFHPHGTLGQMHLCVLDAEWGPSKVNVRVWNRERFITVSYKDVGGSLPKNPK